VVVPPHYEEYMKFSKAAREIYEDCTDQVEAFGMDECWLDVTGSTRVALCQEIGHKLYTYNKKATGIAIDIRDIIEPFVIRSVVADISRRDDLISLYNNTDEKDRIKALKAQLRGLEKSTRKLLKVTTDTFDTPAYKDACDQLKEIAQQKQSIQSEIEKIEASQVTITESDRRKVCNKIMHMLETTDSIEAKKYLQSVISSIAVSNEDVDVTLNIA
jgi:nucleotidyltransferase/DNA polymerase involved in DNA repair